MSLAPGHSVESPRYNHLQEVPMHLDEDLNQRMSFWKSFEIQTNTEAMEPRKIELESQDRDV